jgi:disulfide bond formation protein DsbB
VIVLLRKITDRQASVAAFILCAAPLAVAWGAQILEHLIPCPLCLLTRMPYYSGLGLAVLAFILPRNCRRFALYCFVLVFAAAIVLGAIHAGVELKWWRSPLPQCNAPNLAGLSIRERLLAMPARPTRACEDPDYPISFIPFSFVQIGLLYATFSEAITLLWVRMRCGRHI